MIATIADDIHDLQLSCLTKQCNCSLWVHVLIQQIWLYSFACVLILYMQSIVPDEHDRSDPGRACKGTLIQSLVQMWRIHLCHSRPKRRSLYRDQPRGDHRVDLRKGGGERGREKERGKGVERKRERCREKKRDIKRKRGRERKKERIEYT